METISINRLAGFVNDFRSQKKKKKKGQTVVQPEFGTSDLCIRDDYELKCN